jgi:hypothetical protein
MLWLGTNVRLNKGVTAMATVNKISALPKGQYIWTIHERRQHVAAL